MQRQKGFVARHPFLFRAIPQEERDLVWEVDGIWSEEPLDSQYPTRGEALAVVRERLIEMKEQAEKNLESLSTRYTSPRGITYICPQEKIDEWNAIACRNLQIAEAGLALCQ